jgi:hypothetical protein
MRRLAPTVLAVAALAASVPAGAASTAKPYQLAPWKDELFQYPKILDEQYGGDYLEVEYNRPRDLYARDTERGVKVDPKYVSLDTDAVQSDLEFDAGETKIKYFAVGKSEGGAKAIVIYVHGLQVSRSVGVDDWIQGGNFNRIKNLMMRNDGLYLSPSFSDFKAKGAGEIKALMLYEAGLSPGAPIFVACGSAGGAICWRLLADPETRALLGGILFFDVAVNEGYIKTAAGDPTLRVPIMIASSREDQLLGWRSQREFFKAMKAAVPDYPIRYVLFSAGTHGLSWRMLDWRVTLNWMLGERAEGANRE